MESEDGFRKYGTQSPQSVIGWLKGKFCNSSMVAKVTRRQNKLLLIKTKAPERRLISEVSSGFEPLYAVLQTAA
jgi:hypothetical protein